MLFVRSLPLHCSRLSLARLSSPPSPLLVPRSFVRGALKRPGLDTGDVVTFADGGVPYAAVPVGGGPPTEDGGADEGAAAAGTTAIPFVLEPRGAALAAAVTSSSSSDPSLDPAALLEVVRQGEWFGLRSAAAGARFLQARRRGGRRLAFFSPHFGVCEQWELVGGAPGVPWQAARLGFRNRRFPQVFFAADVTRVGSAVPFISQMAMSPVSVFRQRMSSPPVPN